MKFSTYAEVFTPDHPLWKAYQDGLKKTPGHLLRDVLTETGGLADTTAAPGDISKRSSPT